MNIVGLIPARGGSKGVPRKNIRVVDGHPLIYYTIREARKSRLSRLVLSTDDKEIADVARSLDCEVIDRPAAIADDTSNVIETFKHTLNWLEENEGKAPDGIMLLQPTSPLRKHEFINSAIELFEKGDATSVVSVMKAPAKFNPHWIKKIENGFLKTYLGSDAEQPDLLRQDLPDAYWRDGMIYLSQSACIKAGNLYGDRCTPLLLEHKYNINIDEPEDILFLETLVDRGLIQLNPS